MNIKFGTYSADLRKEHLYTVLISIVLYALLMAPFYLLDYFTDNLEFRTYSKFPTIPVVSAIATSVLYFLISRQLKYNFSIKDFVSLAILEKILSVLFVVLTDLFLVTTAYMTLGYALSYALVLVLQTPLNALLSFLAIYLVFNFDAKTIVKAIPSSLVVYAISCVALFLFAAFLSSDYSKFDYFDLLAISFLEYCSGQLYILFGTICVLFFASTYKNLDYFFKISAFALVFLILCGMAYFALISYRYDYFLLYIARMLVPASILYYFLEMKK